MKNGVLQNKCCFFQFSTSRGGNFSMWRRGCRLSLAANNNGWCQLWFKVGNTRADWATSSCFWQWLPFIEYYPSLCIKLNLWDNLKGNAPPRWWRNRRRDETAVNSWLWSHLFKVLAHMSITLPSVINTRGLLLLKPFLAPSSTLNYKLSTSEQLARE